MKEKSHRKPCPTDANLFLSGFIAAGLTALFYWAVVPTFSDSHIGHLLASRGWVPYLIVVLTLWSLVKLTFKYFKLLGQRRALKRFLLPNSLGERISPDDTEAFLAHLEQASQLLRNNILVNRVISALQHFSVRRDAHKVSAHLNTLADADAYAVESSYTVLKVFVWAIPILGFIGTVTGIGQAVAGFSQSIQVAQELDVLKDSLGSVTSGLGVAFDTTLLALVMSLLIMFPVTVLQKAEERFLAAVENYCSDNLLCRLDDSSESDPHVWSKKLENAGKTIIDDVAAGINKVCDDMCNRQKEHMDELTDRADRWQHESFEQMASTQQKIIEEFNQSLGTMATTAKSIQQEAVSHTENHLARLKQFAERMEEQNRQGAEVHKENMGLLAAAAEHQMQMVNDVQKQSENVHKELLARLEELMPSSEKGIGAVVDQMTQPLTEHLSLMGNVVRMVSEGMEVLEDRSQAFSTSVSDLDQRLVRLAEILGQVNATLAHFPPAQKQKESKGRSSGWGFTRIFGRKQCVQS